MPTVLVPPERLGRWVENFEARHGATAVGVSEGCLDGRATDGSSFVLVPPFSYWYDGPAEVAAFVEACRPPDDWGILLVRKGGFAVARMSGTTVSASKVGQRHVQGRTKAGGQSQQRFARRRDNQARAAYEAAAEHAVRLLTGTWAIVAGGDEQAVREVLKDPRLKDLRQPVGRFLHVPDPRRGVLEGAVGTAGSVRISIDNS